MSAPTTLGSIAALFAGDATLTADFVASGGLWVGGIPEERATLPCCALLDFHEVPGWTFEGGIRQDEGEFKLLVYAKLLAAAEALATDIMAVFDPSTSPKAGQVSGAFVQLSITGATSAWLERTDYRVALVQYRADDSTWVYEITMPYKTFVTRTV